MSRALLPVLTTIVVLAMAPAALGQSPLSVEEEAVNSCGELLVDGHDVEGLCEVDAVSTSNMEIRLNGSTLIASCSNELDGVVGGDGIGYMDEVTLSGGFCPIAPCEEEEGEDVPWQFLIEENGSEEPHIVISACIPSGEEEVTCEFEAEMVVNSHSSIEFVAEDEACATAPSLEVSGEWALEELGEANFELAFRPPATAAIFHPIGGHHNFNGAMPGSEREVTFKNNTNATITTTTTVKSSGTATALARYTVDNGCDGQTLPHTHECDVVVTKTAMGTNQPVAIRVHYAGGASWSEPFLLFR